MKCSLNNTILIELEKETEDTIKLSTGTELWLDTDIERLWHARQHGIVKYTSPNLSKRINDGLDLKKGDKVYIHHLVIDNIVEIDGEKLYKADIEQIYAYKRDGEIKMLMDYIFVEPVENEDKVSEHGIIIKSKEKEISNQGIVSYTNKFTEGFEIGDKIIFQKNCNYKIKVDDRELYRMRNNNVEAIIEE